MHGGVDLTQIALIVLATLGCGLLFERFKQPAVLGYILGGVILSVFNQSIDRQMIEALAELGVILLLFLIGMELSLRSFKQIWVVSIGMALIQLIVSLGVVMLLSKIFSLSLGLAVVLGFSIALSSTAVAIKMLESIGELRTDTGQVAVGVLIAQDLLIVPLIMFIRGMGGDGIGIEVFAKVAIAVILLVAIVYALTRRAKIKLPFARLYDGHEDLQPLAAMFFCFGVASISGVLGLSAAYGAFLGGLIVGNSSERSTMIHATKPIQSVLLMVFFLSVGLLMDFAFIWDNIGKVLILLVVITLGKTALNIGALNLFKQPWSRAFLAGLILSQMGEFAFVLSTIGADSNVIDVYGQKLIISLAALSLALSPLWLMAARRLHDMAPKPTATADQLMITVYGPQLEAIGKIKDTCVQLAQSLVASPSTEKSITEEDTSEKSTAAKKIADKKIADKNISEKGSGSESDLLEQSGDDELEGHHDGNSVEKGDTKETSHNKNTLEDSQLKKDNPKAKNEQSTKKTKDLDD